jgi:sulfate-transporting ATPase
MAGGLIPTLLSFDANTQDWINLLFGTGAIVTVLLNQSGIGPDVMHAIKAIERRIGFATTVMPGAPDGRPGPAAQPKLPAIGHPEGARLVVDGLTVDFGGVVAVKDLSLSIAPGTIHGLIGPNGAGKSTVVDAISGFQKPTSGSVTFGGVALDALPAHRRVQAGICRTFQNLELYEELTVAENLETAREAARRSDREWVEAVVDFVGLRDVLSVRVRDLPHGRRRLVGVARALATKPWLLILDEPAAGLDTEETTRFADLVRGIADCGVTILLIEHDMGLVMGVCNRITVLAAGSLMIEDVPAVVVADEKVRRTYLGEELASAGSA